MPHIPPGVGRDSTSEPLPQKSSLSHQFSILYIMCRVIFMQDSIQSDFFLQVQCSTTLAVYSNIEIAIIYRQSFSVWNAKPMFNAQFPVSSLSDGDMNDSLSWIYSVQRLSALSHLRLLKCFTALHLCSVSTARKVLPPPVALSSICLLQFMYYSYIYICLNIFKCNCPADVTSILRKIVCPPVNAPQLGDG